MKNIKVKRNEVNEESIIISAPHSILNKLLRNDCISGVLLIPEDILKSVLKNPFTPTFWNKFSDDNENFFEDYITNEEEIKACEKDWNETRDWVISKVSTSKVLSKETKTFYDYLLTPYFIGTAVITSDDSFKEFFDTFCPRWEMLDDEIFYSRKEFKECYEGTEFESDIPKTDMEWMLKTRNPIDYYFQLIAEAIYDCYNDIDEQD